MERSPRSDRGQLIGQEILEHYKYRSEVLRVLFTAQDSQTIRDAFGRARPNGEYSRLYAAAVARQQADQIYNLSLTRTATVILGQGAHGVIGVGRVKTPTLAIVCTRELEIHDFVPTTYFEVVATAKVVGGEFQMRHAPQQRILRREAIERADDKLCHQITRQMLEDAAFKRPTSSMGLRVSVIVIVAPRSNSAPATMKAAL